jgi:hypothetical protein
MASQYTAGELDALYYVAESSWGVTPTGAQVFGGDLISLKPDIDLNKQFIIQASNRSFGAVSNGPYKAGFMASLYNRSAVDWRTFFAAYAYGSTTGIADHLGSFSALVAKKVSSSYKYNLYNGCKINTLKISADKPGAPFVFDAGIKSKWVTQGTSKTFTGLQSVTMGAYPAVPAKPVDSWLTGVQINLAAGGLAAFPIKKFSFTVDNKLAGMQDLVTGADAVQYPLEAGQGISEGERDMTFEYSIDSTNETYTNSKLVNQAVTALTIKIGSYTITLSGGVWEANDFPELKQALMEEGGKIRFNAMSIA